MSVALFLSPRFRSSPQWLECLGQELPEERVELISDVADHSAIDIALVRGDEPGDLASCPNLALVHCLWAGVEKLLSHPDVPSHLPIARMVDPAMADQMATTALAHVLDIHQHLHTYRAHQTNKTWMPLTFETPAERTVGILGLGSLGRRTAELLRGVGFNVIGLRSTSVHTSTDTNGTVITSDIHAVQQQADIIINLLPLTADTRSLLNATFFASMKPQSALINLARGAHVVEADLVDALNSGHISRAILDVFATEPLPPDSPLWSHPSATITPHVAANTDPRTAAKIIAANVRAWRTGSSITGLVDRARSY
jgi:glyoxylate/hydroxypyruvate reductase